MSQPVHRDSTTRATTDDGRAANAAPTGLTHREKQRRRIVIAGLTSPTLMTLPSRRVWSAACSKSQLKKLSGNLSARKKVETHCDTIGCKHAFWKDSSKWPVVGGGPLPGDSFETFFLTGFPEPMFTGSPSLLDVLNDNAPIRTKDHNGDDNVYKPLEGELKKMNRAAAASLCNAFYLNNMNFIVGFHIPGTSGFTDPPGTSPGEILSLYAQYLNDGIASGNDADIKAGKEFFELHNDALGGCPIA